LAEKEPSLVKRFYLTGGTALAEFYFQHRLSEDIDLFSEQEVNPKAAEAFLKKAAANLKIKKIVRQQFLGLHTYKLHYKDGDFLKVDFNYYPFPRIEKGTSFGKLEVSSVYDIAVNKIHTVGMKPRARDYVDLYFIFTTSKYKPEKYLQRMRLDSQAKFDWPLEAKNLAAGFLRVKDFSKTDLPKMLKPLDLKAMEKFFLQLARGLKKEIFK